MSDNRLSNLGKDLTKARQQALLIEVLRSDLESWADQSPDVFRTVCDASAAVFDANVKGGKTNVLMVGEAAGQQPASIFGALLGSLDNEFDDLHKREILAKLAGFALNQALGGVVGDAVGDNLNVGAEKMMGYLAEWRGSAPDFLTSFFEAGVEAVADEGGEIVGAIGATGVEAIAGQFSSKDNIYLSRAARKRLKELAPRLSNEATSHETLQLALEMLLVTAQGAPKVIVVKDPLRLDDASLALLAMLVSLEKDLRQVNHTETPEQGRAQTAGISVVLTFTGPQPHDTVENKDTAEKQRAISRLRMMASRYSLLERLDSDIPVPAVRASTFVGREAELKSLWQDWNTLCEQPDSQAKQTWALVKGEPGTGKTALANRFIQQIRSDTNNPACLSIPTLRMLNQTGHSAQATGLASLKNSIVDELRRLNLIYQENVGWFSRFGQQVTEDAQRWAKDARSDDPEAKKRTRGRIGKMISRLVGGDAAVEVASSAKAWIKQDEMRSMREQEFGQSSQANHKEEQYELLRAALNEIRALARKCTPDQEDEPTENAHPLLLLVDDLQWVDDFTAEFLLNEWPADMPVYIIATARGSDSFTTTTGDSNTYQAVNRHRNRLFAELGLTDPAPTSPEQESGEERLQGKEKDDVNKTGLSLASHMDLKGMNQPMLANLIKLTYAGIIQEQAEHFAAGIIKNLSGENSSSDVITLFAIETLNVISDPHFYRRNAKLPRLIEPLPGTDRYRFKMPENMGLTAALDSVFQNLTKTYQASYLVESGQVSGGARFNLASYAVLEERLHLIEQYFGEYGGTARYSLLFSALLGSPFQSGLVRHVLDDLKQLASDEDPVLAPFLNVLQREVEGSLEPAQYELLERAYEIIRRLEENTSRYVHQHSLLHQFLLGQLTQLMDRAWPEIDVLEKGIAGLVGRIETSGNEWFANHLEDDVGGLPSNEALEVERGRFLVALTGYWYQLMRWRSSELGQWAEDYAANLSALSTTHANLNQMQEALPLEEEALSIRRKGYESAPESWAEHYVQSLYNLANVHGKLGRHVKALPLHEKALSISREGYESTPGKWAYSYAINLIVLTQIHFKLGNPKKAKPLLKDVLPVLREGYESSQESWAELYSTALNNLTLINEKIGNPKEALPVQEEALSICRKGYETAPERWVERYVQSLNNLGFIHEKLDDPEASLPSLEEARSVLSERYELAPERWAEQYASLLNNLAQAYDARGNLEEALPLQKEALSIRREGYELDSERWAEHYAGSLINFASYAISDRPQEALSLLEEALPICHEGYVSASERWVEHYALNLNMLGLTHLQLGQLDKALSVQGKVLSICREGYATTPERWADGYAGSLITLASIYDNLDRPQESLPLYEEALPILREGYELAPEYWAENYAGSLIQLAQGYNRIDCSHEALRLLEEAQPVLREGYESAPERWAETYLANLISLAAALEGEYANLRALEIWRQVQKLIGDNPPLPSLTLLHYKLHSLIASARLLTTLKNYSDAISELDAADNVLSARGFEFGDDKHMFRAWLSIERGTTLINAGETRSAEELLSSIESLIYQYDLEETLGHLFYSLKNDLENKGE